VEISQKEECDHAPRSVRSPPQTPMPPCAWSPLLSEAVAGAAELTRVPTCTCWQAKAFDLHLLL